jgi:predicted DNA-binding transcriptional regulator AlpA
MKPKINVLAKAVQTTALVDARRFGGPAEIMKYIKDCLLAVTPDLAHPDMQRRMRAKQVWEYLDESKSSFYARLNPKEASYDPLFPRASSTHSSGEGRKRWKLGAIIGWLRICEAVGEKLQQEGVSHER